MDYERISEAVSEPFSENLKKLQELFPSVVKDGEVDLEALKAELGEFTEVGQERYGLNWAGKQDAQILTGEPLVGKTLKYVAEESKNPETTENIYIEGDNLEALKLLQNSYRGKIKTIYIDPPYNTGNDFVYNDNFAVSEKESQVAEGLRTEEGERLAVNPKSSAKYHANWLSMIYPRLRLAKNLLRDDGVIFISIDDNEVANLRNICDEIFGETNFLANIVWQTTPGSNTGTNIITVTEYVLVYGKSKTLSDINTVLLTDDSKYILEDEYIETRGPFILNKLDRRMTGVHYSDALNYPIEMPDGQLVYPGSTLVKNNDGWNYRWSKSKVEWGVKNGFIVFKNVDGKWNAYFKQYWKVDNNNNPIKRSLPYQNLITLNQFNSTQGTKEIMNIFGKKYFDYPKPSGYIKYLLGISQKPNDIVLDFFSGSATTAHAVMQLNAEDKGNRKFILVQFPEECDDKSEAYKAGYENICEIGKERIRKAGEKIKAEHPEVDVGFKVFKVDDTNIRWLAAESGKQGITLEDALSASGKDLRDFMNGTNDLDVVYEILIRQYGIPLTAPIELLSDIGERTYSIADTVVVCLEEEVTDAVIDKIANLEPIPQKIVFRDSAFGDNISLKENAMLRLDALMQKHAVGGRQPYSVEFL